MKIYFTLCSAFFFLALQAQTLDKAGTLDGSFGTDGKVLTSLSTSYLQCFAVAAQSDGSIIATGNISSNDSAGFFAIKYTSEGVIDPSFGVNGMAYFDGAGQAVSVAIQPDNKILVAGYYAEMFEPYYISIVRFNANGSIDSGFGNKGLVLSNYGRANAIALQADGKILIEGVDKAYALTIRYMPDGTLDNTFGKNGVVETNFGSGTSGGYTIAVQPNEKIVIGGQVGSSLFLARYDAVGILDESFGIGGKVIYDIASGVDAVRDLVLQPDGKIVAIGISNSYYNDTANSIILRCQPDGSLDKSFGNSGLNNINLSGTSSVRSLVLQQDGKIVIGGSGSIKC